MIDREEFLKYLQAMKPKMIEVVQKRIRQWNEDNYSKYTFVTDDYDYVMYCSDCKDRLIAQIELLGIFVIKDVEV